MEIATHHNAQPLGKRELWGSQSWLQPPFKAASFASAKSLGVATTRSVSVVKRGATSKGDSNDWLPHARRICEPRPESRIIAMMALSAVARAGNTYKSS